MVNDPTTNDHNREISVLEIEHVIHKAKNNRAVGIDNLPYEVLKNEPSEQVLLCLFNKVFSSHVIPSTWKKSIIKPLPKNSMTDPRIPLQCRGIPDSLITFVKITAKFLL